MINFVRENRRRGASSGVSFDEFFAQFREDVFCGENSSKCRTMVEYVAGVKGITFGKGSVVILEEDQRSFLDGRGDELRWTSRGDGGGRRVRDVKPLSRFESFVEKFRKSTDALATPETAGFSVDVRQIRNKSVLQ
jgi:hypothetical protein